MDGFMCRLCPIAIIDVLVEILLFRDVYISNQMNRLDTSSVANGIWICPHPQVLAPVVGNDVIVATILPAVLDLAGDNVPNVRFNVAKTLELLINNISDKTVVAERIVPALNKLKDDEDRDVKYFAQKALATGTLRPTEMLFRAYSRLNGSWPIHSFFLFFP
jgi:hypothetical protein